MKKLAVLLTAVMAYGTTAFGCWYKFYNYEDYIYSINNREVHAESVKITDKTDKNNTVTTYKVKNNMVVDFPVSVAVKLVSQDKVILDDSNGSPTDTGITKDEVLSCALQYRVLPNGNWVTVQKYETPTGTIPSSYPPNFYFGRNNIFPKCKPGDVVMIRVYVTDGVWQSGDPASMCDIYKDSDDVGVLMTNPVSNKPVRTLRTDMEFNLQNGASTLNLGGQWAPSLVTTVIWSGKTRAVK